MQTWSSPVGAKFQITIPKPVREALGVGRPGELIGFSVDGSRITLSKAEIAPKADSFTEDEWRKLIRLAKSPARKTRSAKSFLARHEKLTCRKA